MISASPLSPTVIMMSAMSNAPPIVPGHQFASDNTAGVCPEAWAALEKANAGYAPGYGEDAWTARAADLIRELFETDCEVFFTFNGTAANSLALSCLCQSYHSVICSEAAHVETDECGGPEFFSNGIKLLCAEHDQGRMRPSEITRLVERRSDIHYPKPRVVSLTQPTELGTAYGLDQLGALCDTAESHGLKVHMDGARFANAVVALGATPAEVTWRRGVDVLCLGSTKLGAPVGDAVVFFDRGLAHEFDYRCKQSGQLASKMRYLAAPWVGIFEGGAWRRHAAHANACAQRLAEGLRGCGLTLKMPVEVNGVFVDMPDAMAAALRARGWHFYGFIGGAQRFMCSWATTDTEIDVLLADVRAAV